MNRAGFAFLVFVFAGGAKAADLNVVTASGTHRYHVEIAADEPTREHGLMDRRKMAADRGMLFEFPSRAPVTFWMKNTYLPLDMIFIDSNGVIRHVYRDAKPMSEALISSEAPVTGVLELNAGQAAAMGAAPGDKVEFPFFEK